MYNRNLGFLFDDYRPFRILWKLLTDFVADRIEEYVRCTTIRGVATPLMLYKFKTYLLTYTSIPFFDTTMFLTWTSTQNDTVSVSFFLSCILRQPHLGPTARPSLTSKCSKRVISINDVNISRFVEDHVYTTMHRGHAEMITWPISETKR